MLLMILFNIFGLLPGMLWLGHVTMEMGYFTTVYFLEKHCLLEFLAVLLWFESSVRKIV